MDFATLLVVLGLIGTAWNAPMSWTCPDSCTLATSNKMHQPPRLVLDHQNTSIAPWSLENQTEDDREPRSITVANCMECTEPLMVAKPIEIQINVYRMTTAGTPSHWCRCPIKIPVGCTCVREKSAASS